MWKLPKGWEQGHSQVYVSGHSDEHKLMVLLLICFKKKYADWKSGLVAMDPRVLEKHFFCS